MRPIVVVGHSERLGVYYGHSVNILVGVKYSVGVSVRISVGIRISIRNSVSICDSVQNFNDNGHANTVCYPNSDGYSISDKQRYSNALAVCDANGIANAICNAHGISNGVAK